MAGLGNQEDCSAMWLTVSGVMAMGFVSRSSLDSRRLCPYFAQFRPLLVACYLSAKMDSSVRVSGRLAGHILGWCLLPPFGLSHILPNSPSWLLLVFFFFFSALCSLLGPPIVRQLRQVIINFPGQSGQFWSMVP